MYLTPEATAAYDRDGYVLVPELFNPREVAAMLGEVEHGERVTGHTHGRLDSSGKAAKLAIWHELGDDIWAAASTCPRRSSSSAWRCAKAASACSMFPSVRPPCHMGNRTVPATENVP